MANSDNKSGVTEVDVEDSALPVLEVKHPGDEANDDFIKGQNEALAHYRLTGEAGVYIDPTRDQEPDIAPELGVAPHPELANPAPPATSFSGRPLDVASNPMLVPVEEKAENAKDATEAFNEQVQKREEAFQSGALAGSDAPTPQPVYMVDAPSDDAVEVPPLVGPDESPKSRDASPDAQLGQDLEKVQEQQDAARDNADNS